jgi:hypothetical protein
MQSVDYKDLDALDKRFADVLEKLPEARRQMHEEAGAAVKRLVQAEIARSGLNDSHGKIRGWQEKYVGSKGGYVAVRPIGEGEGGGAGRNSAGAITKYLEAGHKTRRPSGGAKRPRQSRAAKPYAKAYGFYQSARNQAQLVAIDAANQYAEQVAEGLGD